MNKIKEFFSNVTKKAWITFTSIVVLLILLVVSWVVFDKDPNIWPISAFLNDKEFALDDEKDGENGDSTDENADSEGNGDSMTAEERKSQVMNGGYNNSVAGANAYVANTKEVKVAVVAGQDSAQYVTPVKQTSCGVITFVTVRVPDTKDVVNQTLKAMFAGKVRADFVPGNIIPTHTGLSFSHAVLENGVVKIHLTGAFAEADDSDEEECLRDLAIAQIVETASVHSTVKGVEIYLGSEKVY